MTKTAKNYLRKILKRVKPMLFEAVNCSGTFDPKENIFRFIENLYGFEEEVVINFLTWLHINNKKFGNGNYEARLDEYLNYKL